MSSFDFSLSGYKILHVINEIRNLSYFRAQRESDGKTVVIKIFKSDSHSVSGVSGFKREYEILNKLKDVDGVIIPFGIETFYGRSALILEDFGIRSGKIVINDRKKSGQNFLQIDEFLKVAIRLAEILAKIHEHNIIHKDISPFNIFFDSATERIIIGGFHFAAISNKEYPAMRHSGRIEGSPEYMSPEQTGRINRIIDSRSDLYSLGATFYELLTGSPPFEGNDILEIVHAHIAKIPQPVFARNPAVPVIISDVIMKLLAKNSDDRYQSAYGLKTDLELCKSAFSSITSNEALKYFSFDLGKDDYSGQLRIPQKLYGSKEEMETLISAFERTVKGSTEFIMLMGQPGSGITMLASELQNIVTGKQGYFIAGKFDQNQQDNPYLGFIRAFTQLCELILTEPEEKLRIWKENILNELNSNGALMTEFIPVLEKIIGVQPPVLKLDGPLERNRFKLTFYNFVKAIVTENHPLVIFIDNLQWIDAASAEIMKILLSGKKIKHLMLVAGSREEKDKMLQFKTIFPEMDKEGITIQKIILRNLNPEDASRLIQDTLICQKDEISELSAIIYEKTQGNLFLIRQFLESFYNEGWLYFDYSRKKWSWEIEKIKAIKYRDNVPGIIAEKVSKFSRESVKLLQIAACSGYEFDLKTLCAAGNVSESEVVNLLLEAIAESIIIPMDNNYKFPETAHRSRFRFLHDNIQQAIYTDIKIADRQKIHFNIARFLQKNFSASNDEQSIFEIVHHYNQAIAEITETNKMLFIAELNIRAADVAYRAAALRSSKVYLEKALNLMPENAWESNYEIMQKIHSQLAYVLSLLEDFERMNDLAEIAEKHARSATENAFLIQAKINAMIARGQQTEVVELGLNFIDSLGVKINRHPSPKEADNYLRDTADWISEDRIKTIYNLPEAPVEIKLVFDTAEIITPAIFGSGIYLGFMFISRIARLCFEYGLASKAPLSLTIFAMTIGSALHDIQKARRLADTALQLLKTKYSSSNLIQQLAIPLGGLLMHRYEHLKHTLPILSEGVKLSIDSGMFHLSGNCAWWHAWHNLLLGAPLEEIEKDSLQAIDISQKVQITQSLNSSLLIYQLSLNLQGKSEKSWILNGERFNEKQMLATALRTRTFSEAVRILFHKAWLRYMFRRADAVNIFMETEKYLLNGTGMYVVPLYYFYDTLANAADFNKSSREEQAVILERINRNLGEFEIWSHYAPMNHQHKKDLMLAEKARIEGREEDAAISYEDAIRGAKKNEFLCEEALSLELAAEFHIGRGTTDEVAVFYIQKSLDCYARWQAWAKVSHLESEYGRLLEKGPVFMKKIQADNQEISADFDIKSVIKASQIISGRIIMEDLLGKLMEIVIENAGASHGSILLKKDGKWVIEAESYAEIKPAIKINSVTAEAHHTSILQSSDIDKSNSLCTAIVRYVIRSRKNVVLDNAAKSGLFSDDRYIKQTQAKSILCIPLINRAIITGILYLENNLSVNVFTPERIEVLELLAGQAAIALENAMLYQQAQQEITERKAAEAALKKSEEQFKTIFDSINDAIIVHDTDLGEIIDVNDKMCSMFGYTREEALKIKAEIINSNEPNFTAKEGLEWLHKSAKEGPQLFEWKAKDKYGRKFWIEVNMRLALINGKDCILVVARDISERKQAEAQVERNLRETQVRFNVSQALAAVEGEDNTLDVLLQQTGFYSDAHVNISLFENDGDKRVIIVSRQDVFKSGLIKRMQTGTRIPVTDFPTIGFFRSDRPFISNNIYTDKRVDPASLGIFIMEGITSMASFPLTAGNEWLGYIGVLSRIENFFDDEKQHLYQTIAEQGAVALRAARLHEKIRESQQRLSLIVQQSPLGVIEWNMEYKVASWNPAAEQIFGYTSKEAYNRYWDILVPKKKRPAVKKIWQSLLAQKGGNYSENQNITREGNIITCNWFNSPLVDSNEQIIGIVSLVQDISERKLVEEEIAKYRNHLEELVRERTKELEAAQEELIKKERLSVLGQLTATVSHELRNPLGVIRSSAFFLKEKIKDNDDRVHKHLDRIESQVDICNWIVEELLEYTRGSNPEMEEGDISSCITNALDVIQGLENIEMITDLPGNIPAFFFDRTKIGRVMTNLITNASHAVKEKKEKREIADNEYIPQVHVSVRTVKDKWIKIIVEDNGTGMNETITAKAFDPLFTTKARGTGLGLSIVKKIIEEHGGKVKLKSIINTGTKAIIRIPMRKTN